MAAATSSNNNICTRVVPRLRRRYVFRCSSLRPCIKLIVSHSDPWPLSGMCVASVRIATVGTAATDVADRGKGTRAFPAGGRFWCVTHMHMHSVLVLLLVWYCVLCSHI